LLLFPETKGLSQQAHGLEAGHSIGISFQAPDGALAELCALRQLLLGEACS
jgi:hypothetical protein